MYDIRYPFHEHQEIELPDWEKYIEDIANMIVKDEQTPEK
jgi:hypothetical protein